MIQLADIYKYKIVLVILALVIVATAIFLYRSKEGPEATRFDNHIEKLNDSFYSDDDGKSIHEKISFFISNISTISFFMTVELYFLKNGQTFIEKLNTTKIYIFHYMEVFNIFTILPIEVVILRYREMIILRYRGMINIPSLDEFPALFVEKFIFILIAIFIGSIIIYVLSISFGRLAISIGKGKASEGLALAIISSMFFTLGIVLVISSFL